MDSMLAPKHCSSPKLLPSGVSNWQTHTNCPGYSSMLLRILSDFDFYSFEWINPYIYVIAVHCARCVLFALWTLRLSMRTQPLFAHVALVASVHTSTRQHLLPIYILLWMMLFFGKVRLQNRHAEHWAKHIVHPHQHSITHRPSKWIENIFNVYKLNRCPDTFSSFAGIWLRFLYPRETIRMQRIESGVTITVTEIAQFCTNPHSDRVTILLNGGTHQMKVETFSAEVCFFFRFPSERGSIPFIEHVARTLGADALDWLIKRRSTNAECFIRNRFPFSVSHISTHCTCSEQSFIDYWQNACCGCGRAAPSS